MSKLLDFLSSINFVSEDRTLEIILFQQIQQTTKNDKFDLKKAGLLVRNRVGPFAKIVEF